MASVVKGAGVMKAASPYLTAAEAAAHLKFPTVAAFHCWRYRRAARSERFRVKVYRRGSVLLFKQSDLDAAVDAVGGQTALRRTA